MEYSLQNAILTLYNYYYINNLNEEYKVINLVAKDIKLDDIKILDVPNNLIKEFKEGKFKIEGSMEGLLNLKRFGDSFPTSIKISFYKNKRDITDLTYPSNRDSFFSLLFSGKVLNNNLFMIKLPIFNFDIKYSELESIVNTYPENEEILKLIDNEKIIDIVSVRIREQFQNYQKLSRYIESNKVNFSELMYQVLICLDKLYQEFPSFNHNKLDLDAIYILEEENTHEYIINKTKFNFTTSFSIKISNFEMSSLNNIFISKNITNRFSDIYYLCYVLEKNEFFKNIIFDKLGQEIFNQIKKISIKNNNGYMLEKIEPTNPSKLLNKYFNSKRTIKNDQEFKGLRNLKTKYFKIKGNLPASLGNQKETKLIRKNIKKHNLKGGSGLVKPNSQVRQGDNMTNDQRMSYKKLSADKPRPREPQVLAEQKIYQQSKPPPKSSAQPNMYPPAFVPVNTPYSSVPIPLPYEFKPNNMPIQNIYNLNIADPRGDHSVLARVYEDMVPGNEFGLSSLSVGQRVKSSNYIKNIMLKSKEGEEMSLTGGKDSILEHIQLHDLNPYHYKNPQKELANGFMLYSSAYPIRYDANKQQIKLGRNNQGINMRIYRLSNEELQAHFSGYIDKLNHNVWRELFYYQKINELMKLKKIPSFVKMHFWVLDGQSNIKWNKLDTIKYQGIELKQLHELVNGRRKTIPNIENKRKELFNKYISNPTLVPLIESEINKGITDQTWIDLQELSSTYSVLEDITNIADPFRKTIISLSQKLSESLLEDSTVSLGIITESAQQTFINWSTPIYQGSGSLKTMIQTGYHEPKVWLSLLFQYIYGLAILQENNINLVNFEPKYNLLVKNIYNDDRDTKHWRYNVDKLTFYLPNNGFIGMIDSMYNKQQNESIMKIEIEGLEDDKRNIYDNDTIKKNVFNFMFKKVISKDLYGPEGEWKKLGGLPPPDEFINLLDKLNKRVNDKGDINIKSYLNIFTMFLHNRAGDRVDGTEIDNLDLSRIPSNITRNKLMIKRDYADYIYKFVVVLEKKNITTLSFVDKYLVWNGEKIESVSTAQLFEPNNIIEPKYEKGAKLDKENVIESYNI